MNMRSASLPAALGFMMLLAGPFLLGTMAWQWRLNTALVESASPGKTPNASSSPFFFQDGMTRTEVEQLMEKKRTRTSEDLLRARQ